MPYNHRLRMKKSEKSVTAEYYMMIPECAILLLRNPLYIIMKDLQKQKIYQKIERKETNDIETNDRHQLFHDRILLSGNADAMKQECPDRLLLLATSCIMTKNDPSAGIRPKKVIKMLKS